MFQVQRQEANEWVNANIDFKSIEPALRNTRRIQGTWRIIRTSDNVIIAQSKAAPATDPTPDASEPAAQEAQDTVSETVTIMDVQFQRRENGTLQQLPATVDTTKQAKIAAHDAYVDSAYPAPLTAAEKQEIVGSSDPCEHNFNMREGYGDKYVECTICGVIEVIAQGTVDPKPQTGAQWRRHDSIPPQCSPENTVQWHWQLAWFYRQPVSDINGHAIKGTQKARSAISTGAMAKHPRNMQKRLKLKPTRKIKPIQKLMQTVTEVLENAA